MTIAGVGVQELDPEKLFGAAIILIIGLATLDLLRLIVTGVVGPRTLSIFLWNGTVDGLIIGLAGVGLSMTYSILRFANFSHGDLITVGAFSGWTTAYVIGGLGTASFSSLILLRQDRGAPPGQLEMHIFGSPLAIMLGLVTAAVVTILVALAIDRIVYRRMRTAGGIPLLIASVGVALFVRYLIAFIYGERRRGLTATPEVQHALIFWTDSISAERVHELTLVICAVGLMIGVHLLLQRTKLGKSMRAMADNRDLALVTGIPTERVILTTWVVGAGLTGIAGFLIGLESGLFGFNDGWFLLLLIFAAVILGGIGSIYGAIAGGLVIGLVTNVSLIWLPSDLTTVAAFLLMILILVFRPSGLFSGVDTA